MSFHRRTELERIIAQTEAMRPLPIDSILAQLKHIAAHCDTPEPSSLDRLTLRRQLTMEWDQGAPPEIQAWVTQTLDIVQAFYDWVLEQG